MYCLELLKFDVSASYYVICRSRKWCTVVRVRGLAVMENDPWRSWKVIGKVMENCREKCGNPVCHVGVLCRNG